MRGTTSECDPPYVGMLSGVKLSLYGRPEQIHNEGRTVKICGDSNCRPNSLWLSSGRTESDTDELSASTQSLTTRERAPQSFTSSQLPREDRRINPLLMFARLWAQIIIYCRQTSKTPHLTLTATS